MSKRNLENILAENMRRFGTKNLNEAGKFYKGSRYNDEPFKFGDDKRSLATKTNPEWDAFVDKYNNTPGFETSTSADGTTYKAEITNLKSGLKWVVMNQKGNNWSYIGRDPSYLGNPEFCRDAKELIANFEEINGIGSGSGTGSNVKEIIDNYMNPSFDFSNDKMYVELRDLDSVLVYDFDYIRGELRLTFNRNAPETKLNNGVDKYIDYIDDKVTENPDKYDFNQKMSDYNQD